MGSTFSKLRRKFKKKSKRKRAKESKGKRIIARPPEPPPLVRFYAGITSAIQPGRYPHDQCGTFATVVGDVHDDVWVILPRRASRLITDEKTREIRVKHLDGSFFEDEKQHKILQLISGHSKSTKGSCILSEYEPTKEGAEYAGKHKDSANYNLYMFTKSTSTSAPYIYFIKGMSDNYCVAFAINHLLQFTAITEMKANEEATFIDAELAKYGMKKTDIASVGEYEPDQKQMDAIVGWMENFTLFIPNKGKYGDMAAHWVVYKYNNGATNGMKWYALDPNIPLINTATFQEAYEQVHAFYKTHKLQIMVDKLYKVEKDPILFQTNVVNSMGTSLAAHVEDGVLLDQYIYQNEVDAIDYINYIDYSHRNTEYEEIMLSSIMLIIMVSLFCFFCMVIGAICGYVAEKMQRENNRKSEDIQPESSSINI